MSKRANTSTFAAYGYAHPHRIGGGSGATGATGPAGATGATGGGGGGGLAFQSNGTPVAGSPFGTANAVNTGFQVTNTAGVAQLTLTTPLAIGPGCIATDVGDVAIGEACNADGGGAIALGNTATATAVGAVCIGASSNAETGYDTAIGRFNNASGGNCIAIGTTCNATGPSSFAIGKGCSASGFGAMALGISSGATTNHSFVTGIDGVSNYTGEIVHSAITQLTVLGDTTIGTLDYVGQTDGTAPSQSSRLTIGGVDQFSPGDGYTYALVVTCTVSALIGGVNVAQAFFQTYSVMQVAGVASIEGTGTPSQIGTAAGAGFTLVAAATGDNILFVFSVPVDVTATCNINCKVEYVRVGAPA